MACHFLHAVKVHTGAECCFAKGGDGLGIFNFLLGFLYQVFFRNWAFRDVVGSVSVAYVFCAKRCPSFHYPSYRQCNNTGIALGAGRKGLVSYCTRWPEPGPRMFVNCCMR